MTADNWFWLLQNKD